LPNITIDNNTAIFAYDGRDEYNVDLEIEIGKGKGTKKINVPINAENKKSELFIDYEKLNINSKFKSKSNDIQKLSPTVYYKNYALIFETNDITQLNTGDFKKNINDSTKKMAKAYIFLKLFYELTKLPQKEVNSYNELHKYMQSVFKIYIKLYLKYQEKIKDIPKIEKTLSVTIPTSLNNYTLKFESGALVLYNDNTKIGNFETFIKAHNLFIDKNLNDVNCEDIVAKNQMHRVKDSRTTATKTSLLHLTTGQGIKHFMVEEVNNLVDTFSKATNITIK
jgi:hypothetical protein